MKELWNICVKDLDVLRKRVPESSTEDCEKAIKAIRDVLDTHDSSNCFGLAANQLGLNIRACLLTVPSHYFDTPQPVGKKVVFEFHNPTIVEWGGKAVNQEWCYSLDKKQSFIVRRHKTVTVKDDKNGLTKLSGVAAYAAQHECLPRRSKIMTENGPMMIGEIVDQHYKGKAWCVENGKTILKPIIGWSKRPNFGKKWVILKWTDSKHSPYSELVCTADHVCFALNDIMIPKSISKTRAQDCGGKYLVRYTTNKQKNAESPLYNSNQLSMIIGCLLGDACISAGGEFCAVHGDSLRVYIEYKASILDRPVNYCETPKAYGQGAWKFRSEVVAQLKYLRSLIYKNGKKTIRHATQYLDDIAMAFWYMDDGCLVKSKYGSYTAQFHTEGFSDEDAKLLVAYLKKQFGIDSHVYNRKLTSGLKPIIVVSRKNDAEVLFKTVRKFIHPSMRYKLPPKHRSAKFERIDNTRLPYSARLVTAVQPKHCESRLYDIEVADAHTMFANDILVHNCDHLNGKMICDKGMPSNEFMKLQTKNQPAQNAPCTCGSGKKYKRCCAKKK